MKKLSKVGLGAVLLAGSSLGSRFLGVARDFVFSKIFGAGADLDAYFAAFRIPDLLYTLLIFGAMSAAFIPIYTRMMKKGEKADVFASRVMNGLLVLLILASGIAWVLAPWIVPLLAPGFEESVLESTVVLTRIMLLSPIFLGLSSVFQGVENSHKKFLGIALAPIVYNLSIIIAAWFFGEEYGVNALAWGVVAGAFAHFAVQVPGVFRTNFKYHFDWRMKSKEMKEFVKLTIPRLFGVSVTQMGIFVDTIIASLLAAGSLSIFNYSMNLQSLPYGVVAVSFSVAVFSTLSEDATENDKKDFLATMKKSTHSILFWVLPAILGLFLLREVVVDLILRGGAFGEEAAAMTALTLGVFVWAALGQSMIPLFARAFYALHETKRPVLIGFCAVGLNMLCSLVLTQIYGFEVWALAVSAILSATVNAGLLVFFLGRFMKVRVRDFFDFGVLLKIVFSTAVMGTGVIALGMIEYPSLLIEALVMVAVGGGLYLGLGKVLKTIPALRGP